MRRKPCKHLKVTFLGMQETHVPGKSLALYNCADCHTTISVPVIDVHAAHTRGGRKAASQR